MYALKNYIYAHVCICNLIYIGLMELYAKKIISPLKLSDYIIHSMNRMF